MKTDRLVLVLIVFTLVAAMFAVAAEKGQFAIGSTRGVSFYEPIKIGGVLLPAGEYKVKHVMEGDNHVMIFTNVDKKDKTAKVNCKMEQLKTKAEENAQEVKAENGDRVLVSLTFKGDTVRHIF